MIRIKKLTPPQIAALREALPNCAEAGVLTTTSSIATFHQLQGKEPWRRHHLQKLVFDLVAKTNSPQLHNVLIKLDTRPELVEVA